MSQEEEVQSESTEPETFKFHRDEDVCEELGLAAAEQPGIEVRDDTFKKDAAEPAASVVAASSTSVSIRRYVDV